MALTMLAFPQDFCGTVCGGKIFCSACRTYAFLCQVLPRLRSILTQPTLHWCL